MEKNIRLGIKEPVAGEGLHRVGAELLHPLAQHVLMNAQVAAFLRHRYPSFPDKLDRLDLKLSTELPSLHDLSRA
jgi:hypothetical protein